MSAAQIRAVIGSALVAFILVLVNYVSSRRFERFDLTRDQLFTLSERSKALLHELDKPVDLYVFLGSGEQSYAELKELISRYRAQTDKLTPYFVDPDREPARFKLLAEKYGLRAAAQENGQTEAELAALVVSGDKRWSITRDDLVDVDYDSLEGDKRAEGAKVNVKTEQALSGAIVQVTSGRATAVCTTEGHGEWSLTDSADRSLAAAREELKRENIELKAIETRGKASVDPGCDAVFVLGPQKAFADEERALLETYLAGGGNLLLALDPVIDGEQVAITGLEALTLKHDITLHRDVLVELDREHLLSPSPVEAALITNFGNHALVRPLTALRAPVVVQVARTLGVGSQATALLDASDKAYGETNLSRISAGDDPKPGEGSIEPPIHLAALADTKPKTDKGDALGGRLIVIGDAEWLSPQALQQPQLANVDLLASFTGFLTEREALIAIAPRKIDAQAMMITEDGLFGVFLRVVLLMPLAALVLGVGVWWQRRQ
ncbi:MAG TPA: GldG family protein [Polyangiales bacterium]|nr:GldG family protein [Polyangiales bacterium]